MISIEKTVLYEQLTELITFQDHHDQLHAQNVADLSGMLARSLGLDLPTIEQIYYGGMMHDIGKRFADESILGKPASLNEDEYNKILSHPMDGYEYLQTFLDFISDKVIFDTVLLHHERLNGTGYPYRLEAELIPIGARICAVADVWDALNSPRCYRKDKWDMINVMEYLCSGANNDNLFDHEVVIHLLYLIESGYMVDRYSNNDAAIQANEAIDNNLQLEGR